MGRIHLLIAIFLGNALISCQTPITTQPTRKDVVDVVFASGHITMTHEYYIAANTDGYIVKMFAQQGDQLPKDAPLVQIAHEAQSARLDNALVSYQDAQEKLKPTSPQIVQLQIQIEQAKTQQILDLKNYERYANLVEVNAVSQLDYDNVKLKYELSKSNVAILEKSLADLQNSFKVNLKNAHNQLRIQQESQNDYLINTPAKGVLLDKFKTQGELVRRGQNLAKMGGGETIIKLFIAEEDISRIKIGQEVAIALNTHKKQRFKAKVSRIYPSFDEKEQSFVIKAHFVSKPKVLMVGAQLQANIVVNKKQNALIIPAKYLREGDKVLLAKDNEEVQVMVGLRNHEWAEILKGLTAKQTIALDK
ncbi:MAG TPA: hypothetical protein DCS93_16740 [Microscillaceae bacterium]|nr:hypothetical protein [Microscillaceae bacterium]